MISAPNLNPNMTPLDNQLLPLALSRGQAVGAQKSTQSRQGAKSQSQTRPELPGQIQTDSKRFKPKKENTIPAITKRMTPQSVRAGPQTPLLPHPDQSFPSCSTVPICGTKSR
jgi:hypothetical protein